MIPAILFTIVLLAGGVVSAGATDHDDAHAYALRLSDPIRFIDDRALVLTPGALYRYHTESETWTVTSAQEGLPEGRLIALCPTEENLWITGTGASVSDIRFDDWQRYAPADGYGGRQIFAIASDDDYAYAATDSGAARYDHYVLEWEPLLLSNGTPLPRAFDIEIGDGRVWFATEKGVAEFRTEAESFRVFARMGQLNSPAVYSLFQTSNHLWALTSAGLARLDKQLETWTSYAFGHDLPATHIHQAVLNGDDVVLGTDDGLWRYEAMSGVWRRDIRTAEMPGERVHAFFEEEGRLWVVTEAACALYEEDEARWIDFTTSVPVAPAEITHMDLSGETLIYLTADRIICALSQGEENPSLFSYREEVIDQTLLAAAEESSWSLGLEPSGLTLRAPSQETLQLKGGATAYIENEPEVGEGLGDLARETRIDMAVSGRMRGDRSISGFYDNTDVNNEAYQLTYRGAREDIVRSVSGGEIEQQMFNSELVPAFGVRGVTARAELGSRSEATRRRLVTADGWAGSRRTFPGRDVFHGDSREITGSTNDVHYAVNQIFPRPNGWDRAALASAQLYRDDGLTATNNANTIERELAGITGAWDFLEPDTDYTLGPEGATLIVYAALGAGESLVIRPTAAGLQAVDLTNRALKNHYYIAQEPIPGTLEISITDSTGAAADYLERFGLDRNGDGRIDPERFSPLTGYLSFPDSLPFPPEVYAEDPQSFYTIEYDYRTQRSTFRLSHRNIVPGSVKVLVDREPLRVSVDYTLITNILALFEHVLLDRDSVIEVIYMYEPEDDAEEEKLGIYAGQAGLAATDHLFVGVNGTRWEAAPGEWARHADFNTRLEWKGEEHFLRLAPEIATSCADVDGLQKGGRATATALQGRYRNLELSASYRNLDADFISMENRSTALGRLREAAQLDARFDLGRHLQTTLEWNRARSDAVANTAPGGTESYLMGGLRLLRDGFPNIELRTGQVTIDRPEGQEEKRLSRAEIELNPTPEKLARLKIKRLWLRSFVQRSDRRIPTDGSGRRRSITDHAYFRLNGSSGNPLSWNLRLEDRRTHSPDLAGDLKRIQDIDATLQSQPHPSFDTYLRWEAGRDRFWGSDGEAEGFEIRRVFQANAHFYPGRIVPALSPVSFRADLNTKHEETGEPGDVATGTEGLFDAAPEAPGTQGERTGILETRLQIFDWLRLVERYEQLNTEVTREALAVESVRRKLESRAEMRPRGGKLTLRVTTEREEAGDLRSDDLLSFNGDWDQTWGHGILTYLAIQSYRSDDEFGLVGTRTQSLTPRARLTVRNSKMRLDTSLGLALTVTNHTDISTPATLPDTDAKSLSLTSSTTIWPLQVLGFKVQYVLTRGLPEGTQDDDRSWETSHDLKLRISVRV